FVPGCVRGVAAAGPAAAQSGPDASPAPGRYPGLVPSVFPPGYPDPIQPAGGARMPPGRPAAAGNTTALERVTAPVRQAAGEESDPVGTLTGQPVQPPQPGQQYGLPYGAYPSPYFTDGPGCCGPLG